MFTFVKNCKAMTGRNQKCKVVTGQNQKICKVFLGRDKFWCKVQVYLYINTCTLHQNIKH